jgi:outer membrane receptor protein involved in Fe transport
VVIAAVLLSAAPALAQPAGTVRGVVYDKDFEAPLPEAQVLIAETGAKVTSTDQGNYVLGQVPPGTYTLVFSKPGYIRQVKANVVVAAGQLTDVDAHLSGEFEEMEEFIVQDLQLGGESEMALLNLRMESPQLMDSISADLMSRAGAGDAAAALTLIPGATVQDGKFAVVRGLPDRYVSSQMNGVRLPTADADKRAVELDQFPSAVIESIQVSKTFTPDQQGDASGGAVNVILKGIPDATVFEISAGTTFNTQVTGNDDFLTYKGGGVNVLGIDDGRDIPDDGMFEGAVGVSRGDAPINYDVSLTAGGKHELQHGIKVGGFASLFYERDSSYYDGGIDDKWWVETPGGPLTPQLVQDQGAGDFKTALFDVTQGNEEVKWGALGAVGAEIENHSLTLLYMYTRVTEDSATLAEDTRGKAFFFPGYNPNDPSTPGHDEPFAAPYLRLETLAYTERTTQTLQLSGQHTLPLPEFGVQNAIRFRPPEVDWTVAWSSATLDQPDKRQFGSLWTPERVVIPGVLTIPAMHRPFKPAANVTLGNLQRIFKEISEDSTQYFVNAKLPFTQWSGDEGYLKAGVFKDQVKRTFEQDTFSNFNDNDVTFEAPFDEFFSDAFPTLPEAGPVTAGPPFVDVDYKGDQDISAWYFMVDLPLTSFLNVIAGVRFERTKISIVNDPEEDATWLPLGASGPVTLNPGDADVTFEQDDVLPSIGVVLTPFEQLTLRASYAETVARQTFKELSPIQQQEFLGGDVFIGNPELQMSTLKNYDLRLDYTPYPGGLISGSWFYKDIKRPIEYVQQNAGFTFTRPVNYPKGKLSGFEFEIRQDLGHFWKQLVGLSMQANATIINSEVTLPDDEIEQFASPALMVPMTTRDMVNAPEYLYNIGLTYDLARTGTQIALFYIARGDTLVAGAGQSGGNFIPDVYAKAFGTLNLSVSQNIGKHLQVKFAAKNLTNPKIEEVYRSEFIDRDVTKSSFRKGIDFSISVSARP